MRHLILIIFVLSPALFAKGAADYSEATDVFEIMDHVTRWEPSLTGVYRKAWEEKFPLDLETKGDFSKYADIRLNYYQKNQTPPVGNDIFGDKTKGYDGFSEAFYSSKSIGEALRKLEGRGLIADDVKFLAAFYRKYKDKIATFVKESSHFPVRLLEINNQWKKERLDLALNKVIPFILGKEGRKFQLILRPVWWPKTMPAQIDIKGPYLIIRFNPLDKTREVPMEELAEKGVEAILSSQDVNQRTNLTKIFQTNCAGRDIELRASLGILFANIFPKVLANKKEFDLYASWSRSVFVDIFVKLLYPLFEREYKSKQGSFAGTFMDQATLLCKKINRLSVAP